MKVLQYTNKGSRDENQDYMSWSSLSDASSIFVVADGMGGYSFGDIAAKVVTEAAIEFAEQNIGKCTPVELLKEALIYGNDCLMLKKIALSAKQMGCVIVVLLIIGDEAYLTWLGDSRIYLFRDHTEVYRTEDHSVINQLSKINTLRAEDLEKYAAIVTKSIMGENNIDEAPIRKVRIEPGDVFILCSDGFYKDLPIKEAYGYEDSLKDVIDAYADKMTDNYTFIKVEV